MCSLVLVLLKICGVQNVFLLQDRPRHNRDSRRELARSNSSLENLALDSALQVTTDDLSTVTTPT